MRKSILSTLVLLAVVFNLISCSFIPQVSAEDLEQVVRRDSVPFGGQSIPGEVIDLLAAHRVVLIGETHHLQEHREFVVELLRELQAQGFRQLLFEWTQAADWLISDFVLDGGLMPDWSPPIDIGGQMLTAVRDLNRTLPEDDRIQVHAIDLTLTEYGGGSSFINSMKALAQFLPDQGPLTGFLSDVYDTPENQTAQLKILQEQLKEGRSALVSSWGEHWYNTVLGMVEVEFLSINVRSIREKDYDESVRVRENAIKGLVDIRLGDFPNGTVINIGSTHAQKERLYGTEIEWLGDYLVHKSQVADGSVIVLGIFPAYIVSLPESGIEDFDLSSSPANELFRVMNQTWPEQIVFLPLNDSIFSTERVPINSEGTIYRGSLKLQFDGFILLPLTHRAPSP